jgi:hypothetical protein
MINYNYITEHIELNNQLYLKDGTICVSEPANGWLSNWIGDDNKRIE